MKAIHGGKAKNDRIDSQKIAVLLRGGMIPVAYVYPPQMRSTRDLLRRRTNLMLMRKRDECLVQTEVCGPLETKSEASRGTAGYSLVRFEKSRHFFAFPAPG